MVDGELVNTIIQGGAVGISLCMLLYLWKRDKLYNTTMNNHLVHQDKSNIEFAKSNCKLAKSIQSLSDNVSRCKFNKVSK